ncbi:hypothetical protein MIB92_12505 [Aestuariirhabdus sp. Z084]|uniref:hypothetical protein n=1 Tax=Aestuariirhabdus haliotis TaxID=2918751 RepID=UPI00201B4286|nr:hypothetical protein [Aestuariirhabdus haliotis]MCL6416476.1 hypothetical protein [Aestuariirhabdus haliotis]MCL6420466.1 hypothetical protein [Aestuariirhabdus haliotis]
MFVYVKRGACIHLLRLTMSVMLLLAGISLLMALFQNSMQVLLMESTYGSQGQINAFFQRFLFRGGITPRELLMLLALGKIMAGVLLLINHYQVIVIGTVIIGLALGIAALPVMTVPMVELEVMAYTSPALLVRIADVGLILLLVALLIDRQSAAGFSITGLRLLTLGIALPLVVGAVFHGMAKINHFGLPAWVLLLSAIPLLLGRGRILQVGAGLSLGVLVYYLLLRGTMIESWWQWQTITEWLPMMVGCWILFCRAGFPADKSMETED